MPRPQAKPRPRPAARRIVLALVAAILLATLAVPAAAQTQPQPQPQPPAPEQPQQAQELAPVMLILDASGSMTEADPSGGTKMDAAKAAVSSLAQQTPANAQLGLTAYGTGTGNSEAERAAGCQDVQVLHPVGSLDPAGIAQSAQAIQPSGYTPIGRSLEVAAGALPAEGPRSIVLVSDGIDTCAPPDPCEIARQLAQQGIDLTVHVVGFALDPQARQQMTCIAEATGGTYTDAANADELGTALNQVTAAALRVYQASGQPIQGGTDQASAPTVAPGAYLDQQPIAPEDVRYYTIEIPAGFTLYATATEVHHPTGSAYIDDLVNVDIYAQDGSSCLGYTSGTRQGPITSVAATYTVAAQETADGGDPCQTPGPFSFRVERELGDNPADLELLFGLEPPLAGQPPAPAGQAVAFTPPSGQPVPVTGGGSFNTAATLNGSGRYTDTLQPGEAVFFRVRLDWGQGFAYQVHFPDNGQGSLAAASDIAYTYWYTVQRAEGDGDFTTYDGAALKLPGTEDALASLPVNYANRDTNASGTSVAGWYYITVQYGEYGLTRDSVPPIPVTLDLAVSGEPQPAPPYAGAEGGAPTEGGEATDAFGGENLGATGPQPPGAGGEQGGGDTGPLALLSQSSALVWGGLAVIVLLLVVFVVVIATSGRNQQR